MLRRVVFAGGLVMVAVRGYAIKQIAFPSPEAAVQRYFDALRDRKPGRGGRADRRNNSA